MASYTVPTATAAWQTAPAPSADAWFQPIGGQVFVSTDASPSTETAGVVSAGVGYPVSSGTALKYRAFDGAPVAVRLWDKT
ncbi:hypothetical protein [Paracoccus sp. DMF]|uniref:hypothetical protein n=1 Tax=Paracoccus sp. DMF TaxID=400837 RepID=UPI0011050D57|nr:hypothetical protein [Paracoccus sp. DMF]MCV2448883.1 hypothetical protein [Paracoccus sp. DMF]